MSEKHDGDQSAEEEATSAAPSTHDCTGQTTSMSRITSTAPSIGLALSGGGIRAAAFHLGVLRELAEQGLLEQVQHLSTVSGGSLIAGLVLCKSENYHWPSSAEFRNEVYWKAAESLQSCDLMNAYWCELAKPWNWLHLTARGNYLAKCIADRWGIRKQLGELTGNPAWEINATTIETGERWTFRIDGFRRRVCEQGIAGSLRDAKQVWLADALAASAAFPGMSSPLQHAKVPSRGDSSRDPGWTRPRWFSRIQTQQLADGGVYDNLGLEAFFDIRTRAFKNGRACDFVLISDGGAPLLRKSWSPLWQFLGVSKRINDITAGQTRHLRVRSFRGFLDEQPTRGAVVSIAESSREQVACSPRGVWPVDHPAIIKTSLHPLNPADFERVVAHGRYRAQQGLLAPRQVEGLRDSEHPINTSA